jgi:hypothetical protein
MVHNITVHCCTQKSLPQVSGCVLTSPAPALSTKQHQLLYVNSRAAVCPVMAQLLRDWFITHVKTLAVQGTATGAGTWANAAGQKTVSGWG